MDNVFCILGCAANEMQVILTNLFTVASIGLTNNTLLKLPIMFFSFLGRGGSMGWVHL